MKNISSYQIGPEIKGLIPSSIFYLIIEIGIVFVISGIDEVLRINGKATIIKNQDVLKEMSLNGKPPILEIGVDVEEFFIHCARALKKARIWEPDSWKIRTQFRQVWKSSILT